MRVALVVLMFACSGPAKHPDGPQKPAVPGLVWATESLPYHLPHMPFGIGTDGTQIMLVGTHGWIAQLDPATGKVVREIRGDRHLTFENIVPIGNGKWVASALRTIEEPYATVSAAYVVDGATLQTTEIKLSPTTKNAGYAIPHVAALKDGGVVITGRGLPLAIYEPSTGAVRKLLDPKIGWYTAYVHGDILIANHSGVVMRYDLSTNGQKSITPLAWTHIGIGDSFLVMRVKRDDVGVAMLYPEGGTEKRLAEGIDALAIDDAGKRLVTSAKDEIRVHALPSGDIVKRIKIKGARSFSSLTPFGNKLIVNTASVIRIVDLDSGVVTPPEQGIGSIHEIAVGDDGRVLVGSFGVFALAGGKQTAAIELGEDGIENFRRDDPLHYATSDNNNTITFHTLGNPATKSWKLPDVARTTWITHDGELLVDVFEGHGLFRTSGGDIGPLLQHNSEAELLDLDPDGDALVALDGRVAVASQEGKTLSTITVPECQEIIPEGAIEPGGPRAATYTNANFALWDRTTGKLLATAAYDPEPEQIRFMPKRQELLLVEDTRVVLWSPGKGTHAMSTTGVGAAAVSSDGKRLALGYTDGHIAVWDVDTLLAGPAGPDLKPSTEVKPECGKRDPLAPNPPDDGDGDGEEGGVEGGEEGDPD